MFFKLINKNTTLVLSDVNSDKSSVDSSPKKKRQKFEIPSQSGANRNVSGFNINMIIYLITVLNSLL